MYTVLLPPGVYPIAVKYIISYRKERDHLPGCAPHPAQLCVMLNHTETSANELFKQGPGREWERKNALDRSA